MKMKLKKLRTVALRILPVMIAVVVIVTALISSAAAVGYSYEDFVTDQKEMAGGTSYNFEIPTSESYWTITDWDLGTQDFQLANPAYFTIADHRYSLDCFLFRLDLNNIKAGSQFDFNIAFDTSLPMNSYLVGAIHLRITYYAANGSVVGEEDVQINAYGFERLFFDGLEFNVPEAAYATFNVVFDGYELYDSGSISVGFVVSEARFHLTQFRPYQTVSLFNGLDNSFIQSFEDLEFPCVVDVTSDGFTITDAGSSTPNYTYICSGDAPFLGLALNSVDGGEWYPIGSTFKLMYPDSLFLLDSVVVNGHVSIMNYTGSQLIQEYSDFMFPCKVFVGVDGLYFTYPGSDQEAFFFAYGSMEKIVGVSEIAADKRVMYAVGDEFSLIRDTNLYVICEGDLPKFPSFVGSGDSPGFDIDDFDSSYVDGVFSGFSKLLNSFFNYIFLLFWRSELLHSILLMSAVFSIFSFLMFGKK